MSHVLKDILAVRYCHRIRSIYHTTVLGSATTGRIYLDVATNQPTRTTGLKHLEAVTHLCAPLGPKPTIGYTNWQMECTDIHTRVVLPHSYQFLMGDQWQGLDPSRWHTTMYMSNGFPQQWYSHRAPDNTRSGESHYKTTRRQGYYDQK